MGLLQSLGLPVASPSGGAGNRKSRATSGKAATSGEVQNLTRQAMSLLGALADPTLHGKALLALEAVTEERKRLEAKGASPAVVITRQIASLGALIQALQKAAAATAVLSSPPTSTAPPATAKGEIGHVAPYDQQGGADWRNGVRTSENEHVIPRGKQEAVTFDAETGKCDFTDAHYRKNTTVRVERETALHKTHEKRGGPTADNTGTKRLKAEARAPTKGINYREDVFNESLDNMKSARDATQSKVTDGQIHRAALAQDGELFGIQRMSDTGERIGATADDIDRALETLDFGDTVGEAGGDAASAARAVDAADGPLGAAGEAGAASKGLNIGGRLFAAAGKVAAVGGAFVGGLQVGSGVNKIADGDVAEGAVDVGEGAANIGLGITGVAVPAEAGLVGGGLAVAAGVAAAGSVALAAETVRATIRGEETPIDIADEFYGTHFGDLHGWVTGVYDKDKKRE
jgi:hypothetical protein